MPGDDDDPWKNTKKLLGGDFFDVRASEQQARTAMEAELVIAAEQGREFSVLAFLDKLGEGSELEPGVYCYGGDEAGKPLLAKHDVRLCPVCDGEDPAPREDDGDDGRLPGAG